MGYHSGINGEYSIPVEVNSKYIKHFRRCCKEEVPEKAIKVETYLKDDTIYFVLPNNYKPVKICFDSDMDSNIYGGKGNQKLNVNIDYTVDPHSSGYYYADNSINISDSNIYENSNAYTSLFDSLLDLSKQVSALGNTSEEAEEAIDKLFNNMFYNK